MNRTTWEPAAEFEPALRDTFGQAGFAVVPQFLQPQEIDDLLENVKRYIRDVVPSVPREHVFYEDRSRSQTLKQLPMMQSYDAYFCDLLRGSRFDRLAAALLGDQVEGKNVEFVNKLPHVGTPTPPHQDGFYFMIDPCEALTIWLALDVVDEENGCIRYVRGSHLRGMRAHAQTNTFGFSQGIADYPQSADLAAEVAVSAQPGDLLIHHAMTIHRAEANHSENRSRRALAIVYYSQHAKEDTDARQEYQARLAEQWKAAGKI